MENFQPMFDWIGPPRLENDMVIFPANLDGAPIRAAMTAFAFRKLKQAAVPSVIDHITDLGSPSIARARLLIARKYARIGAEFGEILVSERDL